jgi:hypothetical protein
MASAPGVRGRNIVVVGASAGGVEALIGLVGGLPSDLPAALFVVLHIPSTGTGMLPEILRRKGPLPADHARDGEPIEPSRICVAPPNHHLLIRDGRVRLSVGPRENRQRPALDPLFRTAARAHGRRVVGIVLSGSLDDGTAGLGAVKARGGVAIVQDPAEALFDSMPRSALASIEFDAILPVARIGAELARLAREPVTEEDPPVTRELDLEARIAGADACATIPAALLHSRNSGDRWSCDWIQSALGVVWYSGRSLPTEKPGLCLALEYELVDPRGALVSVDRLLGDLVRTLHCGAEAQRPLGVVRPGCGHRRKPRLHGEDRIASSSHRWALVWRAGGWPVQQVHGGRLV